MTAILSISILGNSSNAQDRIWRPSIELEARGTSIRTIGQAKAFIPLAQNSDSLLFADVRGLGTDGDAYEGNFGLGLRWLGYNDWIIGLNSFFDIRTTEVDNTFYQGTVGAELLSVDSLPFVLVNESR